MPRRRPPRRRPEATPSTFSQIHASFAAGKYGDSLIPDLSLTASAMPAAATRSHTSFARASCHTMALWHGVPSAPHASDVSRWFEMPTHAMSPLSTPAFATTSATVATTLP